MYGTVAFGANVLLNLRNRDEGFSSYAVLVLRINLKEVMTMVVFRG
jgi:hypothetical protein